MVRTAAPSPLGPEFDAFLFAPIGEDRNGMLLSVLSALARLDVDPWQEAAKLARLPGGIATERLAALIAALPDGLAARLDPRAIAARLVALLPRRSGVSAPAPEQSPGGGAPRLLMVAFAIFVALVLITQYIVVSQHPPAQLDNAPAPPAMTAAPLVTPPPIGQ